MNSHAGPGCAEKGEGGKAVITCYQRPTPFLHEDTRTMQNSASPRGQNFPTATCGKHFQFNYNSPSSPGGFVPLLHSAVMWGYTCPGYHRHTAGARFPSPGKQKQEPWWLPLCLTYPQTQVLLSQVGALSPCTLIPVPSQRNHLHRHHPLQK